MISAPPEKGVREKDTIIQEGAVPSIAPSLDIERLVEPTPRAPLCRSAYCRWIYRVNLDTGEKMALNCKSWRCPVHRIWWGRKWSAVLSDQLGRTPCDLLINLTTSGMISNDQANSALRQFIKNFRKMFGKTEYVKVVEYNQRKSQPHFHLLLINPELKIPPMPKNWNKKLSWPPDLFKVVRQLWRAAMERYAPSNGPTTVVWVQPPKTSAAASSYALKYITGEGKDEEPDATWLGRKLSYSRGFFTNYNATTIWNNFLDKLFPNRHDIQNIIFMIDKEQFKAEFARPYWHIYYPPLQKTVAFLNAGGNRKPPEAPPPSPRFVDPFTFHKQLGLAQPTLFGYN